MTRTFIVVALLFIAVVAAQTTRAQSLAGDWSGQSTCAGGNPACHDEYIVYHLTVNALDSTNVKISADKIVDGKLDWMGDIVLKYDAAKQTLTGDLQSPRYKGIWEFAVKGNIIEGTLSIFNPEKTVGRRIRVQRNGTAQKESANVTQHATGTFEVKMLPSTDKSVDPAIGRMTIDKQWSGDITGNSKGDMLSGGDLKSGAAGYVAMEKVTGAVKGRKGSFIFQHSATMNAGAGDLNITVVPGSGTEELKGLSGKLTIKIEGGKHIYDFEYTIN